MLFPKLSCLCSIDILVIASPNAFCFCSDLHTDIGLSRLVYKSTVCCELCNGTCFCYTCVFRDDINLSKCLKDIIKDGQ